MFKTLHYAWETLKTSYEANGIFAPLSIFSKIYENTLFPFFQIFLLSQILNLLQRNQQLQFSDLSTYALWYVIAALIKILLVSWINQYPVDIRFEAHIDKLIIGKLTTLDPATFESSQFQELLTQIETTKGTMLAQLERITGSIDAISKIITAALVLLPIFPLFVPLILVSVIPSFYVGNEFRKKLWPYYTSKKSPLDRLTQYVKDLLSQDSTSKEATIFHTGPVLQNKVISAQDAYKVGYNKINNPFIIKIWASNVFQQIIFLWTQYVNLLAVLKGTLGIGQFSLAFQQTLSLATGSQQVLDMYSSMTMRTQIISKFYEFLDYKPAIMSPSELIQLPTAPTPPKIEFKDVAFRYPKTKRDILKNFNITIEPGEKIALVGENGAGKTTIIKLLLRFYDVTEGEILINGVNISKLSLDEWHSYFGALFQDFIKYQFTFKENVYFGMSDEKNNVELLQAALTKSGASRYMDQLPKGMDQVVGKMFDGGIDLSGGQWQKLALARAFFRNAPILILDEPTSAIDAKAEYEIFENVQKLQKDKTVIIISHRFSTVRNADRILVLDGGKIIEQGNHEKLMKEKGTYAQLFEIQAKGYK